MLSQKQIAAAVAAMIEAIRLEHEMDRGSNARVYTMCLCILYIQHVYEMYTSILEMIRLLSIYLCICIVYAYTETKIGRKKNERWAYFLKIKLTLKIENW